MAQVELHNVNKAFGSTQVITNVELEINKGEFVVFVGPSGCGKSTLLRLIAGLESLTSGEIIIADRPVMDLPPSERGIAMVFQSYALYPHMSVFQNMAFSLSLQGISKAEIAKRVQAAAKILQMEHLLDRRPAALSGGQRQRVAIGRAIVRNPDVFLFDEPLSNLDAALRHDTRVEISKLHRQLGATTIYVTHDQVEAMTLADKIVVLKDGEVMQVGAPMDLFNQPDNEFVAGFLGSPKMNFFDGILGEIDTENGSGHFEGEGLNIAGVRLVSRDKTGATKCGSAFGLNTLFWTKKDNSQARSPSSSDWERKLLSNWLPTREPCLDTQPPKPLNLQPAIERIFHSTRAAVISFRT